MSDDVFNEIVKWMTSVATAFGMSVFVLGIVRPLIEGTGEIDFLICFAAIVPLALAGFNLTNLRK